ncbi:ARMT1-like domain-containing protein [Reichenbachiella sp. MSK19-1]|uniref:ARMT1-like domain-containing protein n=1 Tax=Reichenbachiella sp. MSK19-1 TaxID=1897631 RepID=UPI000E6D0DCE|nr:ARMT1-like domain-containing protein [Reichenbachiella sp. MSK19-1]RJE74628.1 hypothetical protein BGP76_15945 [Reichenbachiella sp. MSK19-1]
MLSDYPQIPIDPHTFAGMTFRVRYPKILNDVLASNLYPDTLSQRLKKLKTSLETLTITRIHEHNPLWETFYQQYEGQLLLSLPFFDAEVYLFAYILHLVDYDSLGIDPFSQIKAQDLNQNVAALAPNLLASQTWDTQDFVLHSLHGNKSDLSQLKSGSELDIKLLLDDRAALVHDCEAATHVDVILDNAGMELFSDLLLVNHLVERYGHEVKLHFKSAPIFVSDVIREDIGALLDTLLENKAGAFAQSLQNKIDRQQIILQHHPIWTSPTHYTQLPEGLITPHALLLSKGDANYRRFFEDRVIPPTQPSAPLCSYLTHPTYCIRTLKSDIQTGLSASQSELLDLQEPDWKVSGKNAVIQMIH